MIIEPRPFHEILFDIGVANMMLAVTDYELRKPRRVLEAYKIEEKKEVES